MLRKIIRNSKAMPIRILIKMRSLLLLTVGVVDISLGNQISIYSVMDNLMLLQRNFQNQTSPISEIPHFQIHPELRSDL